MHYYTSAKFEKQRDFFVCSTHRKNDEKCSSHYIRTVVLEDMVWLHMEAVISYGSGMRHTSGRIWNGGCRSRARRP